MTLALFAALSAFVALGIKDSHAQSASPAAGAQDNSAPAPTIHNGDLWMDRLAAGDKELRVTALTSDTVTFTQWGADMQSTLQWNPTVYQPLTEAMSPPIVYDKPLPIYEFPLTPGKTWKEEVKWQIKESAQQGRTDVDAKVGDWSQVTVPAGTYRALEVDVTIRLIGRLGLNNTTTLTYWYVPAVNRFVKYHSESQSEGTIDAQMVSYKPGT